MTTETTFAYSSAKTAIEPVVEDRLRLTPAPHARQMDILFDATQYSAFPCVVRLEGDELLLSFRQAPRQSPIRHTHPRSVGTVLRSYDLGETWDAANATQLAAGGGGGVSKLYRGAGRVVGALAKHSVAPLHEAERAGLPPHPHEYPFAVEGTYWVWSDNWGLTWPLAYCSLVSTTVMSCAEPCALPDGTILLPTYGTNARAAIWSALLYRSIDDTHIAPEPTIMALGTPDTREYYEPALVQTEPGHLYALHRVGQVASGADNTFWANESFDGGATWTEPVDTGIISGACPRLLRLSDGRLLLTYGRRQAPFAIRAMLSADGGKSWGDSAYIVREAPNGDQGYTSTIELGGGRVLTVSYMQNDAGVTGIVATDWRLPEG
jgi:hypothetical protein